MITFVDRLIKLVHVQHSKSADTAPRACKLFVVTINRRHWVSERFVFNIDVKPTSNFWIQTMKLFAIDLKMSLSHHPHTDRLSEVMNRVLENYIWCYLSRKTTRLGFVFFDRSNCLKLIKTEKVGMSPFELDLAWRPKSPLEWMLNSESNVESAKNSGIKLKQALRMTLSHKK